MIELFETRLREIYNNLIMRIDVKPQLSEFRAAWGQEKLGEIYQRLCKKELKQDMGSFYTPYEIVRYMTSKQLDSIEYEKNPYVKILDPSCGGGYFLFCAYEILLEKAIKANINNPQQHVLKHNIFGCDTDEIAIIICVLEFYERTGIVSRNLIFKDFLLEYSNKVDIILGNPPYLGHKRVDKDYRQLLSKDYSGVYYDKGDIAYCFIKKAIEILAPSGKLMFFTSRYILEASAGEGIRKYLQNSGHVESIIDFYGVRVVKGAGVDTIIIEFTKQKSADETHIYKLNKNALGKGEVVFNDIENKSFYYVKHTSLELDKLSSKVFSFLTDEEKCILDKIKGHTLEEICNSYQGIITGCDNAFVMKREEALQIGIEPDILKPWIKNRAIKPFEVVPSDEVIIYSNAVSSPEKYYNAISYISNYRKRLENRRECRAGSRKWYELQWGRKLELFEELKIVYPYKAASNRFAIDKGNCFSADVYCIVINDEFKHQYSYEYLAGILNSSLYEFYIKSFAKKLGNDLFDYYPNKIMTLRIPEYIQCIEDIVRQGINIRNNVDNVLYEYLGISDIERKIINKWC